MRTARVGACLWLSVVSAGGCVARRDFPAPVAPGLERLTGVRPPTGGKNAPGGECSRLARAGEPKPSNVLVLSGGGMNGAYAAGLLTGWGEAGTRPRFDVVTGISAGALIAPFAFLGPEYDAVLERNAVVRPGDVYRRRPLAALPWLDSLADSGPLRRRIEAEVTEAVLAEIARAHRSGRRLYVGTTDLDTKRLVVWDMGAIAAGDDPHKLDLFRKVLLASCSIPGFLPPVPLNVEIDGQRYTELHVDGGVRASLFLQPEMLGVDSTAPPPVPGGTVFVIVAGRLEADVALVQRRILPVSGRSISGLLQAQVEGDLLRVYTLSQSAGARFALAAVPQNLSEGPNPMAFDAELMRQLFREGQRLGRAGQAWRAVPPELDPHERRAPRTGIRLTAVPGEPPPDPTGVSPGGAAAHPRPARAEGGRGSAAAGE